MILTIDIRHLAAVLKKTFPEIEETKLKSALFDLILEVEASGKNSKPITPVVKAEPERAVRVDTDKSIIPDISEGEDAEDETDEVSPDFSPLVEESSWADLAKKPKKSFKTEDAFDLDGADTSQARTAASSAPSTPPKKARRKRKQAMEEFEGLSDLEIARLLTEQQIGKQKRENGQFIELGSDTASNDNDLVFD